MAEAEQTAAFSHSATSPARRIKHLARTLKEQNPKLAPNWHRTVNA